MSEKQPTPDPCEPRQQICREDAKRYRKTKTERDDQGIRKDQRGQEQPADKNRAQKNR